MKRRANLLVLVLVIGAAARAEIVDRLVAAAGGRGITWSAAFAEARYQAFRNGQEPPRWSASDPASAADVDRVVAQMIDRALLEQVLSRSPFALSGGEELQRQKQDQEKNYSTPAAFREALSRYHLTEAALEARLARESLLLAFIDATVRPQVRLAPEQIEGYYQTVLLPELFRSGAAAPPLDQVSARIEEILTQQEMDRLLQRWLEQLRRGARVERWTE